MAQQAPDSLVNQQLLPFTAQEGRTFANFVVGGNGDLVNRLVRPDDGFAALWLWGLPASGKSHLAHAACHWQVGRGAKAAYVPLASAPEDPEVLHGLAGYDLVALDDLQHWLGRVDLERALMGLYQGLVASRHHLLVVAERPATAVDFALDDVGSRLRAAASWEVRELDDPGKALVLADRARRRGLEVPPPVLDFWFARRERTLSRLLDDFERLDRAAWSEQRRLTVPLLKKVLGL